MARHGHVDLDAVEEWDIDKLIDYSRALAKQLAAERGKSKGKRR